jgi:hypothetical protein
MAARLFYHPKAAEVVALPKLSVMCQKLNSTFQDRQPTGCCFAARDLGPAQAQT